MGVFLVRLDSFLFHLALAVFSFVTILTASSAVAWEQGTNIEIVQSLRAKINIRVLAAKISFGNFIKRVNFALLSSWTEPSNVMGITAITTLQENWV